MWQHIMAQSSDETLFKKLYELEDELKDLYVSWDRVQHIEKHIKIIKNYLIRRGYKFD